MKTEFTFTLVGQVDDKDALYKQAYAFAARELSTDDEEVINDFLIGEDGEINVEACIITILDQTVDGCSVFGSDCAAHQVRDTGEGS